MMSFAIAAAFASLATLVACEASVYRELARAHRDTSRFPLYGVRSDLVMLVATGTMREDDVAWQSAYVSVNRMLDLRRAMDAWDFIKHAVDARARLKRDADARRRYMSLVRELRYAGTRVPAFGSVMDAFDKAFSALVHDRSGLVSVLRVVLYAGFLYARLRLGRAGAHAFPPPATRLTSLCGQT